MNHVNGIKSSFGDCNGNNLNSKNNDDRNILVLMGASGHLASTKIYPALWYLFKNSLLPSNFQIIGYARSDLSVEQIRSKVSIKSDSASENLLTEFWSRNHYVRGSYDKKEDFIKLNDYINSITGPVANKVFQLSLPNSVFKSVMEHLSNYCFPKRTQNSGFTRLLIEKPFGHDLDSSNELSNHLSNLFDEKDVYRIDHYLGKEMVLNILYLRFANRILAPMWSKENIESILISMKELSGVAGRGGYFDDNGIIRDVIQNHITQLLCLLAMEKPKSSEIEDIRNAKVDVLKFIQPPTLDDVVLGQYIARPGCAPETDESKGYTDDPSVPKDSCTETYACIKLGVNNERWSGVPFLLRAGKALDEYRAEIRIKFKSVDDPIFPHNVSQNELVIRIQKNDAIYFNVNCKTPGVSDVPMETCMDLTYSQRHKDHNLLGAYERLLLDVYAGNQWNFVRSDELYESWRIFTPLLDSINNEKLKPFPYPYGAPNGPEAASEFMAKFGVLPAASPNLNGFK